MIKDQIKMKKKKESIAGSNNSELVQLRQDAQLHRGQNWKLEHILMK